MELRSWSSIHSVDFNCIFFPFLVKPEKTPTYNFGWLFKTCSICGICSICIHKIKRSNVTKPYHTKIIQKLSVCARIHTVKWRTGPRLLYYSVSLGFSPEWIHLITLPSNFSQNSKGFPVRPWPDSSLASLRTGNLCSTFLCFFWRTLFVTSRW